MDNVIYPKNVPFKVCTKVDCANRNCKCANLRELGEIELSQEASLKLAAMNNEIKWPHNVGHHLFAQYELKVDTTIINAYCENN
jgi:hypothetical protein